MLEEQYVSLTKDEARILRNIMAEWMATEQRIPHGQPIPTHLLELKRKLEDGDA